MALPAARVYLALDVVVGFARTTAFAMTALYRFRGAHLDAFQLVAVGTAMELAILVFEIPTGVVADMISRRMSIWIGHVGMGLALVFEAAHPSFGFVLGGQIMWGVAYTFTSGATTAWLAGELDDDRNAMTSLFLKASRWSAVAALIALPISFGLGAWSLRAPLIIGGLLQAAVGLWLIRAMPEQGFTRANERTTWAGFAATTSAGWRAVRHQRALLLVAIALMISGAMEPFDRYREIHLTRLSILPRHGSAFVWLTVVAVASSLLAFAATKAVERAKPSANRRRHTRWMVGLSLAQAAAVVVFGASHLFWLTAAMVLVVDRSRSLQGRLMASWLVPLTPRAVRATAFSFLEQANSLGEVVCGPALGALARTVGTGTSLVVGGSALVPIAAFYAAAGRVEPSPTTEA